MKRSAVLCVAAILFFRGVVIAADGPAVLFMWTDDQGKQHFEENFNAIPQPFRKTAVKGVFLPDKKSEPARPKCENASPVTKDTNYHVSGGTLHVEGSIVNGYSGTISYLRVKVSFLDAADQFVKAESAFVDPLELGPCETGTFSIVSPAGSNITKFKVEFSAGAKEVRIDGSP